MVRTVAQQGGAERLAVQIAARLDPQRFSSCLVSTRDPQEVEGPDAERALSELAAAGVPFVGLGRKGAIGPRGWARFVREARARDAALLHAHAFGTNVWATLLRRPAGARAVVCHEHTWSYEGQPLRRVLDRELIGRFADAFVAVSREDRRRMIEIERVHPGVIRYVPNGAPPGAGPSGRDVRAELGIPADAPVVGSVGHLRRQKAYWVLIRAAALLREHHPGLRVLIAGAPADDPEPAALIDELGLGDTVHLLGPRPDAPDVVAALDVAVCCSDFEGMPLSVLEYMEAGVPVVASAVGALPDLIEDGISGRLVPRRDPQALAAAIGALLADPARARELGEGGRERRRAEFDLEPMVRRLEDLYDELLGGG